MFFIKLFSADKVFSVEDGCFVDAEIGSYKQVTMFPSLKAARETISDWGITRSIEIVELYTGKCWAE